MHRYPATDLDRPEALLALAGSFWSQTYAGSDVALAVWHARARLEAQIAADVDALRAAVSRLSIPPLRRILWRPLALVEADRRAVARRRFDDGTTRYDGTAYFDETGPAAAYPLPPGVVSVPLLFNRLSAPSRAWVRGLDYELRDGLIVFRTDPLDDPLAPVRVEWAGGAMTRVAEAWACAVGEDRGDLRDQFGVVAGVAGPPAATTRDAINAALDAVALGSTRSALERLFGAALGSPFADAEGTVEEVVRDRRGLVVVTTAAAYRYGAAANPLVAPGDRVRPGDALADAVRIHEFGRGVVPDDLAALACGPGTVGMGYFGDLVFPNREVPLDVDRDPTGHARVRFDLGGLPGDVERFWGEAHAEGLRRGTPVSHLFDTRANAEGPSPDWALPATVNPLRFLARAVLRHNVALVRVRPEARGPDAAGWAALRPLRRLLPPQTLVVVLAEFEPIEHAITMDGPGDATRPGCGEAAGLTYGLPAAEAVDAAGYVAESVALRAVTEPCA